MLNKTFQLYLHGKIMAGTQAESAREALAALAIPPEDIAIASSSEQKVVFDYQGDVYVLQDLGYQQKEASYYDCIIHRRRTDGTLPSIWSRL